MRVCSTPRCENEAMPARKTCLDCMERGRANNRIRKARAAEREALIRSGHTMKSTRSPRDDRIQRRFLSGDPTVAVRVGELLRDYRRSDWPFDSAWRISRMIALDEAISGAEHEQWRIALDATRSAWESAYMRRAGSTRLVEALAALEPEHGGRIDLAVIA